MKLNKGVLSKYVEDARTEYDQAILPLRAAKTVRAQCLRLQNQAPPAPRFQDRADIV